MFDEIFELVAAEQCQQCCLTGNGGISKEAELQA